MINLQANEMQIRTMEVHFALKNGTFDGSNNVKIIKGYSYQNKVFKNGISMYARLNKEGGVSMDKLDLTVYGLLYKDIAMLSTINFRPLQVMKNRVRVFAGYGNDVSLIFEGDIIKAAGSFSDPNIPFKVEAQSGYFNKIKMNENVNIKGQIKASKVFETLAKQSDLTFQNVDVDDELDNPVLVGGSTDQILNLSKKLGVQAKIDSGSLIVAKRNTPLYKGILKIGKDSGLLNYPTLDEKGINFRMRFNKNIRFGSIVDISTIVPKASGLWRIYSIEYNLENYHERFEISIKASYLKTGAVN